MGSYFPVNLAILRHVDTTWKMQANILPLFINKKNRKNMSDSPKKCTPSCSQWQRNISVAMRVIHPNIYDWMDVPVPRHKSHEWWRERGVWDGVILGRWGFEIESGPQHWHSHYGGLSLISRWSSSEYRRHKGAYFTMRIWQPSWQYWTFKLNYSDYFDLGHRRYGCCVGVVVLWRCWL